MKKITILVGFEATEETINSMSAGAMVELKREPTNTADPCLLYTSDAADE